MLAGNPARLLAPLALVAAALAIFLVVRSETSGGDSASSPTPPAATTTERTSTTSRTGGSGKGSKRPRTYTVKPGDVLSGIAEKTGVPLSRLEELNPDVDPQALRTGQKLKLRG